MQLLARPAASRKDVLRILSLGGIVAVTGYALREYVPWVNYEAEAAQPRRALPPDAAIQGRMEGMIRYATLAANGHNAQPWKFAVLANAIEIHPDYTRRLVAVDPVDRELWISLGCALENLLIAARVMGYAPEVTYPETHEVIRIGLTSDKPRWESLFDAIPLRQNTRAEYDGRPAAAGHLEQLQRMPLEPGVGLHLKVDRSGLATVAEYVHQAAVIQYADPPFLKELIHWLRFDKKEALASFDGLYSACTGNPAVPRWVGRMFVTGAKPRDLADADVKKLRSSAGAIVITSASETKADWVRTGQVYQRLALTMTAWNIKSAFLNQPVEVESVRSQLQTALDLGPARPQLLVRFGYADPMPRSLRRPVAQVLMHS
ncbi:MAG: Tat pathway signal protein [Acidobacteria bacterium]|nr:Tat pathway signal protein [Acidobacteriota bacterium]